jgi:hypothetical protein
MLEDFYGHTSNVGMVGELTKSSGRKQGSGSNKATNPFEWLGGLRWSRKTGQGFKVGSPLMKDGSDDWQTQALLG